MKMYFDCDRAKLYTIIIITNIDLMFETKHPQIIIVSKFKSQGLKMLK